MFHQQKKPESKIQETFHPSRSQLDLIKININWETELFLEANKRREEGKIDVTALALSRSINSFNDLIENKQKMHNAKDSIECLKVTRMKILIKCQFESCFNGCEI